MKHIFWLFCLCAGLVSGGDFTKEELFFGMDKFTKMMSEVAVAWKDAEPRDFVTNFNHSWGFSMTYDVVHGADNYISIRGETTAELGGMHPTHLVKVASISRRTGRILKLENIAVNDAQKKALLLELRKAAAAAAKCKSYEHGRKMGYIQEVNFTDNFFLDDKGIHFVYNQNDIASYAHGILDCLIPVQVLVNIQKM